MSAPTDVRQLVVFQLGGEQYALPIDRVQEIIRYAEPRPVASTVEGARGVISLRGRIVPVYDIASRLGVIAEEGAETKIVIVESEGDTAGVIVDSVAEVLTISADDLDDGAVTGGAIEAIVRRGDRLIALLSPDRLWSIPEYTVVG